MAQQTKQATPVGKPAWLVPGARVQLHPATDAWMRGDRYGEISSVGRTRVAVRMERSGLTRSMLVDDLLEARG